jgi:O-antigen ligase
VKYAQIYGDVFEPRIAGPLGDPNFYAQALVLLVPLGLSLAMSERAAHRKAIALAGTGLVVGAAALTYSRGGALALAVVLALSLLAWPLSRRRAALATGLVAVLVALLVPAGFARRLTTLEQVWPGREAVLRPDSSLEKRRLLVGAAWRMFLDHPLAGVGAGNYTVHFESYADEVGGMARDYEEPDERHYPHSLYLEIAAETGLVGLVGFGGVIAAGVVSLRRAREAFRRAGDERTAALVQGFAIALFGYLVSSLFLHGHYQRYLWLLLGFASALDALASARAPSDEQGAAAP